MIILSTFLTRIKYVFQLQTNTKTPWYWVGNKSPQNYGQSGPPSNTPNHTHYPKQQLDRFTCSCTAMPQIRYWSKWAAQIHTKNCFSRRAISTRIHIVHPWTQCPTNPSSIQIKSSYFSITHRNDRHTDRQCGKRPVTLGSLCSSETMEMQAKNK